MNLAEHVLGPQALARHGGQIALRCEGASVTYAELALQVERAAEVFRALGVMAGERVLLLSRDTPEHVAAWLGAARAGAVAVALNTRISEAEYLHVCADSSASVSLVEDHFVRARPDLAAKFRERGRLVVTGASQGARSWRELASHTRSPGPAHPANAEDPAFWLYSSGTTGKPKAIVHAHKDVLQAGQVYRDTLELAPGDKVFVTSKLFFAYALDHGMLGALAQGLTCVLHPDWPEIADAVRLVDEERPTLFASVPSFYRRLAALPDSELEPFRHVRYFLSGGERIPESLAARWKQATGGELLSIYGMSETFCVCMVTPRGLAGLARPGKPLAGVDVRLLTESASEARIGEPGVLWVRHPALASGYANLPQKTSEAFQDGWFCTHDVFVRDASGLYTHQGRSDEMLKIAGQYVQPGEIEQALAAEPLVAEAVCVPVLDGDGFDRLALFVTARGDAAAAIAAAERACEAKLPRFKRPKWVLSVPEIPRTATGKVQRFRLKEILARELGGAG
ncbi:MAG TPA: AMP-binding protein [Burkholderiales bacterium]|nr:AMP-binding protein [Burkholderiales bacterium]